MSTVVLIADPEESSRQQVASLMGEACMSAGISIEVREAEDGDAAEALIREHRPQLIVSEVLLEKQSGLQLLRKVTAMKDYAPTWVFVSHMTSETDRYWGLRNGAHAYVRKPYEDDMLRSKLLELLENPEGARPERPA